MINISTERDAVYRPMLLGGLYYQRTVINGAFIYDLVDQSVGIDYPNGVARRISKDWYDDEQYNEPADDVIMDIVLEVLATDITDCEDDTPFGCSWPYCVNSAHCNADHHSDRKLLGLYIGELAKNKLLVF